MHVYLITCGSRFGMWKVIRTSGIVGFGCPVLCNISCGCEASHFEWCKIKEVLNLMTDDPRIPTTPPLLAISDGLLRTPSVDEFLKDCEDVDALASTKKKAALATPPKEKSIETITPADPQNEKSINVQTWVSQWARTCSGIALVFSCGDDDVDLAEESGCHTAKHQGISKEAKAKAVCKKKTHKVLKRTSAKADVVEMKTPVKKKVLSSPSCSGFVVMSRCHFVQTFTEHSESILGGCQDVMGSAVVIGYRFVGALIRCNVPGHTL